jgi:hypothetical protein
MKCNTSPPNLLVDCDNSKLEISVFVQRQTFVCSDAHVFAKSIRNHWKIENASHWTLDVIFRADDNRMRFGHSAENFVALQYFSLNLLKIKTTVKTSVRIKHHMCANDKKYLQKVLRKKNSCVSPEEQPCEFRPSGLEQVLFLFCVYQDNLFRNTAF